ncbi:LysR family transcriptional regulator [Pigmentiphaga soli]
MDRLRCLRIFSEVVRVESFVKAARNLSISKATVSKHVAWLEESIGAKLLNRTTTQLALTEAGRRVLDAADDMLDRYGQMEAEVRESISSLNGSVSIGTPLVFGVHYLMDVITDFNRRYPDIDVTVLLDDGRSDLVADGLDLSVRIAAALDDASYIACPLLTIPQVLVATPTYLARHGRPRTIQDLARHSCLVHPLKSPTGIWRFLGEYPEEVHVRSPIRSTIGDALRQAALMHVGISMHPYFTVSDDINAGLLEVVLPDCTPPPMDISIIYSHRKNIPVRVRHLLDFLKDWARNPPELLLPSAASARPGRGGRRVRRK